MNVVDSSGWLEYYSDGENAKFFVDAIEDFDQLIVPTISLYEVHKFALSRAGASYAATAVSQMSRAHLADLDHSLARSAAELSILHRLPMADSIILATARLHNATLLTQDADFEGIEGVLYFPKR